MRSLPITKQSTANHFSRVRSFSFFYLFRFFSSLFLSFYLFSISILLSFQSEVHIQITTTPHCWLFGLFLYIYISSSLTIRTNHIHPLLLCCKFVILLLLLSFFEHCSFQNVESTSQQLLSTTITTNNDKKIILFFYLGSL